MCYHKAYHKHWAHHAKHKKHWENKFRQRGFGRGSGYPPVNIEEFDDRYEMSVFAAGFYKSDFQLKVKDHLLVVSASKEESEIVDNPSMKRQEFDPRGFKRVFELNEKINKEDISAVYEEGVLKVTLPKLAGAETYRKDIDIV